LISRIGVGLNAVAGISTAKPPEGWHLGTGPEGLRILQPNRQPLFAQLEAYVLQVWTDLLLVLHQVLRLKV
jgi:hypothetical protein